MQNGLVVLVVTLGILCVASSEETESNVMTKELTSATFEHYTQASTGATTGDWFIMFFAPWCGFCKQLHPTWNQLATELHQQVNVATVDATIHKDLSKRFEIRGYPTLIFLSKGKMYKYEGARDLEALKAFALGGFESEKSSPVPSQPSLKDFVQEQIVFLKSDFNLILMQAKFAGALIVSLSFIAGFVFRGFFASSVCAAVPSSRRAFSEAKKDL